MAKVVGSTEVSLIPPQATYRKQLSRFTLATLLCFSSRYFHLEKTTKLLVTCAACDQSLLPFFKTNSGTLKEPDSSLPRDRQRVKVGEKCARNSDFVDMAQKATRQL